MNDNAIAQQVCDLVLGAHRVVVLTGAGMSAESGVPTFRDALTGYWSHLDPQELATPQAFQSQPETVFGWYVERLHAVTQVKPHPGYHALVEIEKKIGQLPIVTQNVDGLHRRAGSAEVSELHGSLTTFRCVSCASGYPVDQVLALGAPVSGKMQPPACGVCGDRVRPGVVWFGEVLPATVIDRAHKLAESADLMIVVGTSAIVYPAAALPEVARGNGATVVEVNPERTPFSDYADIAWNATAGDSLTALAESLR